MTALVDLMSRWFLSRAWQDSRVRKEAAGLMLLVGSMLGHTPPHIEPLPTPITARDDRKPQRR